MASPGACNSRHLILPSLGGHGLWNPRPELMASPASTTRTQPRKQRVLACEGCRSRRTRCDGRKPACGTCEARGCECQYPEENKRTASSVEDELSRIRSQLDRIENVVTAAVPRQRRLSNVSQVRTVAAASPWTSSPGYAASIPASPEVAAKDFPYMKLQTSTFNAMVGLGEDYGNMIIRLEQMEPLEPSSSTSIFVLQHAKVMACLQSFSARIHPWYPILEGSFSECISSFLAKSFERGTDAFLVLMILASGALAHEANHARALQERPDVMYLNAAMGMFHLVVLEQSLRSVQCLVAASIHYLLLLRPLIAHDMAMLAIKKAQNIYLSGSLQDDQTTLEHWVRVYRIVLLIEGELVIPLRLADTNAWESEEEIGLPTSTDIWSFEIETSLDPDSPETAKSSSSNDVITYLLAEIAMRRMLRRNTTAITASSEGTAEYAPLIAKELEVQLEQWFSFLPEPLRFSRELEDSYREDVMHDDSLQTAFLRTQYWACMVSFYWPAVVQVMESQCLTETTVNGCQTYFHSYREFIKSATAALTNCLGNKWTLYASIFSISLGAYVGASSALIAPLASKETWQMLRLARDAFGDDCRRSPALSVMADSVRVTLQDV